MLTELKHPLIGGRIFPPASTFDKARTPAATFTMRAARRGRRDGHRRRRPRHAAHKQSGHDHAAIDNEELLAC
jgi:hypothetical protein